MCDPRRRDKVPLVVLFILFSHPLESSPSRLESLLTRSQFHPPDLLALHNLHQPSNRKSCWTSPLNACPLQELICRAIIKAASSRLETTLSLNSSFWFCRDNASRSVCFEFWPLGPGPKGPGSWGSRVRRGQDPGVLDLAKRPRPLGPSRPRGNGPRVSRVQSWESRGRGCYSRILAPGTMVPCGPCGPRAHS